MQKVKGKFKMEPNKDIDNDQLETNANFNMDSLTEGEVFPEPKENAIEAVKASKEEERLALEAENVEGEKPVKLKKDGTPAKKRGRKPQAQKAGFYNPDTNEKQETQNGEAAQKISSDYAAKTVSTIIEQLSVKLISDEWIYTDMERENNINAWRDTFDHYGGVTLTPPQALVLSHIGIIAARATKPVTKSKFKLAKEYIALKIAKWKSSKNALSDNRENVKREDDVREEKSSVDKKA